MQNLIIMLFGALFAYGLYQILAHCFKVPTYKQARAIINLGKAKKKQTKDSDAFIMDIAMKVAKFVPIDENRERKLNGVLTSAEIPLTAKVYLAQAYVKAGLVALGVIPCLLVAPILSPVFVIIASGVYFSETTKAEKIVKEKREDIEYELPRFVATVTQSLASNRNIKLILETYAKSAGPAMKNELLITTADMGSGNYESALARFDTRISSSNLSQVITGLQTVLAGSDATSHFLMLSYKMKEEEIRRLKRLAMERPPKIRKFSFMLLGCMLMIYMGVMGYQIINTMSGMF